jgi:transposase InsO family protein
VNRTNYYRKSIKQKSNDGAAVAELQSVHQLNPYYGVVRFAIALRWSEEKSRRIRNLAGIKVMRRSKKYRTRAVKTEVVAPTNALAPYIEYNNPERPWDGASFNKMATESGAWVQDFSYICYRGQWVYLAIVAELLARNILGWQVGLRHTKELVHNALLNALSDNIAPPILHDDQGGEYLSYLMQDTYKRHNITLSCSDKSSPWQNGFCESIFSTLKTELGNPNRFDSLEELYEAIAGVIYYYNHERIHTALRTSPVKYAKQLALIG